ncbi:MAG TPA: hypothetical protein PLM00_00860 [Spirochaetota bacterium]|nr:hypothetical protein [Spirochaetota bacterium]
MRKTFFILFAFSLLFVFAACGDDETSSTTPTTTTGTLPSRYAVEIPKTLKGGSTTPTAPRRVKGLAPESMALQQIKRDVAQFEMMQKQVPMQFVLVDAVMPQLLALIGDKTEVTATNLTMTITQSVLDKIKDLMGEELYNTEFAPMAGTMLNQPFPIDPITYKKLSGDPLYDHLIVIASTNEIGGDSMTIRWNNAKTKVSILNTFAFSGVETSQLCTYDDTKKTSFMSFKDNMGMSMVMALAQTNALKNGVLIKSTTKMNNGGEYTYETVGMADDDGGYVEMFSTSGSDKWGYRESFDGLGNQTGYAFKGPTNSDWVVQNQFDDSTYYTEDTSSYAVAEVKVTVSGLSAECDFFLVPPGTTTIDETTTMLGSGHYDGASMTNDTSWVMYWGDESAASTALVFKSEFNGTDMTFSQIVGAAVSVVPAP